MQTINFFGTDIRCDLIESVAIDSFKTFDYPLWVSGAIGASEKEKNEMKTIWEELPYLYQIKLVTINGNVYYAGKYENYETVVKEKRDFLNALAGLPAANP